jgi:sterol desaturase/sphingolipid hydroxylase (fatty acid hydroxylase superfamily)
MTYHWFAALTFLVLLAAMTVGGKFLAFKIPALEEMRRLNSEQDRIKMSRKPFRDAVNINNKAGLYTNLVFYFAILPFCVSFESRPLWQHAIEIVAVLLVFDFMYYLTHRFLFHDGFLKKVHALHHQSHKPTFIDALYVHPLETTLGLSLFLLSIPIVAAISGATLSTFSMAITTLLFTQLNTINHTYVNLPYFPFKILNYITGVHAAHHIDISHGNFATLTMFYDKLFGTFEAPVVRSEP